jgi:hypothetical protein
MKGGSTRFLRRGGGCCDERNTEIPLLNRRFWMNFKCNSESRRVIGTALSNLIEEEDERRVET